MTRQRSQLNWIEMRSEGRRKSWSMVGVTLFICLGSWQKAICVEPAPTGLRPTITKPPIQKAAPAAASRPYQVSVDALERLAPPPSPQDLDQTSTCPSPVPTTFQLPFPADKLGLALSGKVRAVIFPAEKAPCLRAKNEVALTPELSDLERGLVYYRGERYLTKVNDVVLLDLRTLSPDQKKWLEPGLSLKQTGAFVYVSFEMLERRPNRTDFGVSKVHPMAQTVAKKDAETLQGEKARFIDVRPPKEFSKGTIPGAFSFPILWTRASKARPLSPKEILDAGVHDFETPELKDVNQKVVIFANNDLNWAAYNAVTFFAMRGFRNLYWLREGYDGWKNEGYRPPEAIPSVEVISADRLLELARQGLQVIDARSNSEFKLDTIVGAVNRPFRQKYTKLKIPKLRKPNLTLAELKKSGESVTLAPLRPRQGVIVFGTNGDDWRAAKAALWATGEGRAVYWYRNGMSEWIYLSLFDMSRYLHSGQGSVSVEPSLHHPPRSQRAKKP